MIDALFDDADYQQEKPLPTLLEGEWESVLALERETALVRGDDGLLARKVALHSRDKAHFARYYADIVGTAMKTAYGGPLAWVELFSGPGQLWVEDLPAYKPGSPIEALTIRRPFDYYVFADLDDRCTEALRRRVERVAAGRPDVHVLHGDANSGKLHDEIRAIVPENALMVLYADQAGITLKFDTIRYFAERYEHLDLLLNFPRPGAVRALRAGHGRKVAEMVNHPAPAELIGPTSGRSGLSLREWFEAQLAALDPPYEHFASTVIKLHTKNVPIYDLMLASRKERATQFFREAIRRGPGGQHCWQFQV